eukprot:CAMPEP_0176424998 /NCGR_PEP_ID=MMETSP0127-20121128/11154_1 /TAXON_ID=938130 /ORGANISM="Platyophrya macrostoma, Strain WH" /LENGTH=325 /DNA_ID=CAMNT_0017806129 /DNA_START=88 /DNA_END=1065 /DNA_ORIENTATION=+
MAQRLAKKPMSEGFDLWDRGYSLGAMRLFIFKAETSPPFQLGPCLDAIGHLLLNLEEYSDAKENFGYASEKYELIQQPVLAELMKLKGIEAVEGAQVALPQLVSYLNVTDPQRNAVTFDAKTKAGVARAFAYLAELYLKVDAAYVGNAIADAEYAVSLGWDRVHTGYVILGEARQLAGDFASALQAFEKAISLCPNYLVAYEHAVYCAKQLQDKTKALELLNAAINVHPRSALIREKAFLISDLGNDVEALQFLEELIANPPPEETEAVTIGGGSTLATLLKAKAAILADSGRMEEALAAAQKALEVNPGDEEAESIVADIQGSS